DAHARPYEGQARVLGDVLERPVGLLAIQPVGGLAGRRAVVQQQDVEPAVVVEVEEGATRPHDARHPVITYGLGVVVEADAALLGDVLEQDGTGGPFFGAVGAAATSDQRRATKHGEEQQAKGAPGAGRKHHASPLSPRSGYRPILADRWSGFNPLSSVSR